MYAVVSSGGKQYRIEKGETLRVEKIAGTPGTAVTFDQILLISDGENLTVGRPTVENALVQGHIVEQARARKVIVFKFKRRKRFRRKQGHRQPYTAVMIDSIQV